MFVVLSLQTTKENLEEEERVRHTPAKNNTYSSAGSDVTEALKKGKHRNKKIKRPRTTKSLPQSSGKTHEEETPKPRTRTRKQQSNVLLKLQPQQRTGRGLGKLAAWFRSDKIRSPGSSLFPPDPDGQGNRPRL